MSAHMELDMAASTDATDAAATPVIGEPQGSERKMDIKIALAHNGIYVTEKQSDWSAVYPDTMEGKREFIFDLLDVLGWHGSRYDKERIYIEVKPGDKYTGN